MTMTEKTLKQDEIDALFEAARSSQPESPRTEVRARVVPYNFSTAGQISTEQLRAISMLNDLFARNLTHNLSAWLRTRFQVNLVSAEQIQFNEFLLRIPEISYVASVRLEPLGALSVMQVDLGLAPPIIDLLLGGEGRDGRLRELTDIEESILGSVVEIVCRELTAAWQQVGLSFNFERRQMQTQVARVIPVNEKTLCLSFEIRMPHSSGLMNLAFPAVVANTILRRLTSDWTRRRHHASDTRARMEAHARRIRFGCSLQTPVVRIQAKSLENLRQGDIVRFDLPANTLPSLRAGGQVLSDAQAVRQGPHRAARIERLHAGTAMAADRQRNAAPIESAGPVSPAILSRECKAPEKGVTG
jgi:flagellar motor switch protein FliM